MSERVVIVGGTSGIGLAAAVRLAASGREVVVTGRTPERLERAVKEIGERGSGAVADARDPEAMRNLFAEVGQVDHVVINVSGRKGGGPFRSLSPDDLRSALDDKLVAQVVAAQAALAALRRDGSLTFVSAASANGAMAEVAGLAAVNGAIESMVPGLAVELAPVRVNAVSPGVIDTEWWDGLGDDRQGMLDAFAAATTLGRVGTPTDVANAIAYLVETGYTTGTVLTVDGGVRLKPSAA
ncbi:SDR family oxidoreductase [Microbispora sp. NPDC046973]|uniref:SDR family oxidoreductase n=1 Tax=Microbispora sp. NPDC046973 TaxID=3155022 RepID=UPI0033CD3011